MILLLSFKFGISNFNPVNYSSFMIFLSKYTLLSTMEINLKFWFMIILSFLVSTDLETNFFNFEMLNF